LYRKLHGRNIRERLAFEAQLDQASY